MGRQEDGPGVAVFCVPDEGKILTEPELMNMQLGCAMPQHLTTFAAQRTAAVNSLTVTFLRRSQHGKRNYKLEKAMAKSETKTH